MVREGGGQKCIRQGSRTLQEGQGEGCTTRVMTSPGSGVCRYERDGGRKTEVTGALSPLFVGGLTRDVTLSFLVRDTYR